MAIVISGTMGHNIGKTVTCIRLLAYEEHFLTADFGDVWLVDTPLEFSRSEWPDEPRDLIPWAPDKYLMPIRPQKEDADTWQEARA